MGADGLAKGSFAKGGPRQTFVAELNETTQPRQPQSLLSLDCKQQHSLGFKKNIFFNLESQ